MIAHRRVGATLVIACAVACGARTGLDARANDAGTPRDAGEESRSDASPTCDFGAIVADVFGAPTSWSSGAPLPAGHYRVTYVDGCLKYSTDQGWTVDAYPSGPDTLWIVANGARFAAAPGTVGFHVGQGGFASFAACVSANLADDAPFEFDFAGGTLGLELADDPYSDNVPGESGRSPTYRLSSCP